MVDVWVTFEISWNRWERQPGAALRPRSIRRSALDEFLQQFLRGLHAFLRQAVGPGLPRPYGAEQVRAREVVGVVVLVVAAFLLAQYAQLLARDVQHVEE